MEAKEKATISRPEQTQYKGNNLSQKRKILAALKVEKLSAVELNSRFRFGDARKRIYELRAAGHLISDYWVQNEGSRYKIYFLK